MKIAPSSVALFDYVLTDSSGQEIDRSREEAPLAYLHGHGNIIPGLEEAMVGREAGEHFQVEISADKAYGVRDEKLIQTVSKDLFEEGVDLEVGMKFQVGSPEGGAQIVTVAAVEESEVTLDGNHDLAGVDLHFDITIREVREATGEELAHGHVHGPGGHHH